MQVDFRSHFSGEKSTSYEPGNTAYKLDNQTKIDFRMEDT